MAGRRAGRDGGANRALNAPLISSRCACASAAGVPTITGPYPEYGSSQFIALVKFVGFQDSFCLVSRRERVQGFCRQFIGFRDAVGFHDPILESTPVPRPAQIPRESENYV